LAEEVDLAAWRRLNKIDAATKDVKPWEAAVGAQLEAILGPMERVTKRDAPGDFIISHGPTISSQSISKT
jgi:hypothetical protein